MATRTLYLVRHGQYRHMETDRDAGVTVEQACKLDAGLTPVGIEQARLTAQRLNSLLISAIHCSTLPRALETAEIIAQGFPAVPLHRSRALWECIPCVPPARAESFARLFIGDLSPGQRQAEKAFDRYFKRARGDDKREIVVSHGNLIRYFICSILQAPPESWVNMNSYNCGISQVQIESSGPISLVSYNDVGHLPRHLRT
jgi:serine/threonine-protein phosphatase PGAM5